MTDLILPTRKLAWWEWLAARAIFVLGGVPVANMVSPKEYVRTLEELGFADVVLEDISEHGKPISPLRAQPSTCTILQGD